MDDGERRSCWEIKACGLEPGGERSAEHGVCPVAQGAFDAGPDSPPGPNHGRGAGRSCWTAEHTLCHVDDARAPLAGQARFLTCMDCPAFREVCEQEGTGFDLGLGRRSA